MIKMKQTKLSVKCLYIRILNNKKKSWKLKENFEAFYDLDLHACLTSLSALPTFLMKAEKENEEKVFTSFYN